MNRTRKKKIHANEGDSRQTWRIINVQENNQLLRKGNQKQWQDHSWFSRAGRFFQSYFSSIGPKLACENNSDIGPSNLKYITRADSRFKLRETNYSKVFSLLSKLCKSKATGLDFISARLLRESADLIAGSLCSIFNFSTTSGIFPQEWKWAKVIPLFKQGDHSCLNNYRPVSIIPAVAKVLERIIYDQICNYLIVNNTITNHQSGFR